MNHHDRSLPVLLLAGVLTFGAARPVHALGFRNPDQGARATGEGEAFVARADDTSAVYYNPAGLVQLQGTQGTSGGYLLFPNSHFSGGKGVSAEMNSASFTPHLYAASDFGLERWRFGFGVNVPFGNVADYGNGGPMRYTATDSMLSVMNFTPAVAFSVTDQFSVGVGLNVYYGSTELNRMAPLSAMVNPLLPDRRFHFQGDGTAVGATVGALWHITDQHSIGAVYRSPFTIDFNGAAVVRKDPTGLFGSSNASAEINFPQSVSGGYAFKPNKKWRFEADIEWTNWDTLNNVRLRSHNPYFDAANNPTSVIPFNWKDSFFYEAGMEYVINDTWAVRGGYIYSENSVPDKSFSGSIPDSNRHIFSIGLGFTSHRFQADLAYQYTLMENRTVSGSPDNNFDGRGDADGRWSGDGHALMLTSTLKF